MSLFFDVVKMSNPEIFPVFDKVGFGAAAAVTMIAGDATTTAECAAGTLAERAQTAEASSSYHTHWNDAPNVVRRATDCHSKCGHGVRVFTHGRRRNCERRVLVIQPGRAGRWSHGRRKRIRHGQPGNLPLLLLLPQTYLLPHRTAYLAHHILAFAVMGQYIPRRIAVPFCIVSIVL